MNHRQGPDIILLSLPVKVIDRPSLCLPVLTAHLRKAGFHVQQGDQNMILMDRILSAAGLDYLFDRFLPVILRLNLMNPRRYTLLRDFYRQLGQIKLRFGFQLLQEVKEKCRQGEYRCLQHKTNLEALQALFSLTEPLRYYFSAVAYYADSLVDLGLEDPILEETDWLIQDIIKNSPAVVGLSIFERQREFSLWFARRLRPYFKGIIVAGGSDPTLNREKYLENHRALDIVVVGDGHFPMIPLLRGLQEGNLQLEKIENIVYRKGDTIISNRFRPLTIEGYPIPDYRGIPLSLYIFKVRQVLTAKGCPWSRCKFCMHWNTYENHFSQRPVQEVVDEIEYLNQTQGVYFFVFVDETIPPGYGRQLAEAMLERRLDIRWMTMSRLETEFREPLFHLWYKSGCRVVEWGLETGSQRVINDMDKGIQVEEVQRIIHESGHAGIINKMLMFHNYPIEKLEDLYQSIAIIWKNTRAGLIKPMLTLRHSFILKLGAPLTDLAFSDSPGKARYFYKTWKPASRFSVNAKHLVADRDENIKKRVIAAYLLKMREFLKRQQAFITDNSNITMDLVLISLQEEGRPVALDPLPPRKGGGLIKGNRLCR